MTWSLSPSPARTSMPRASLQPDLDRRHLDDAVPDDHHRRLGVPQPERLGGKGERARPRLDEHLDPGEHAGLEPPAGIRRLDLHAHRAGARVEIVHDAGDRARERLPLIRVHAEAHRRGHPHPRDVPLRHLDLHLHRLDIVQREDAQGGRIGSRRLRAHRRPRVQVALGDEAGERRDELAYWRDWSARA